jgi:hypothetical protein
MVEESPWSGTGPGAGAKISFGLLALLVAATAFLTVQSVVDGDVLGAVVSAAATVVLAHLVGFFVNLWWRPRRAAPSPRPAGGAVIFRYSGWTYYWMASFAVLMILALSLIGWGLLRGGDITGMVIALVAFAGVGLFGWALVQLFYGGRGWLRLTPSGLEHHGPGFIHRLSWDSIADVGAANLSDGSPLLIVLPAASAPVDVTFVLPALIGRRHVYLLPSMAIRGVWLADDPLVVHRTLRHYHVNPDHRVELSSEAAVERIRQGRFLLR